MAIVKAALIQSLMTIWKGDVQKGLKGVEPQHSKIATSITSTTKSNTYGWLGKFPKLREWIGERQLKSIKEHAYSIINKKFESSIGIGRDDIEDDEVGIYSPMFEEMGRAAEEHPDELVFELLGAGDSTLCYDGQNFFDTDHPVYPNVDGTGTAKSVSNFTAGSGDAWYLLDTSRAIKPIILQNRRMPHLQAMTKLDDETVFMTDEFRFGVDCRRNVGFSFWQLGHCSKAELNADNLWAAVSAMRAVEGDGGKKLAIKPKILVVPVSMEKQATRLLERELDSNSSNELKGRLELLVADYL